MCGRFNVTSDPLSQLLMELVGLPHPGPQDHNLAPTQSCAVLRMDEAGEPELAEMRWWLTPYWSKAPSTKYSMFNAKSETAAKSPAFREPYRKRRCVVPISGFYEWAKQEVEGKVNKVPYYIRPNVQDGLLLAGLCSSGSMVGARVGVRAGMNGAPAMTAGAKGSHASWSRSISHRILPRTSAARAGFAA